MIPDQYNVLPISTHQFQHSTHIIIKKKRHPIKDASFHDYHIAKFIVVLIPGQFYE